LKGVTSISSDTHKYGCALKGTSVILFRNFSYLKHMYFVREDWCGGVYGTPTVTGSKSGALIAACWASLMSLGRNGFEKIAQGVIETREKIINGVKDIKELKVLGDPKGSVISLGWFDNSNNIFKLLDAMEHRGFELGPLLNPRGAHISLTANHIGKGDKIVEELKKSVKHIAEYPEKI